MSVVKVLVPLLIIARCQRVSVGQGVSEDDLFRLMRLVSDEEADSVDVDASHGEKRALPAPELASELIYPSQGSKSTFPSYYDYFNTRPRSSRDLKAHVKVTRQVRNMWHIHSDVSQNGVTFE